MFNVEWNWNKRTDHQAAQKLYRKHSYDMNFSSGFSKKSHK